MFARRATVLHVAEHGPAPRTASVARSPNSDSGTFPITKTRAVDSGDVPTPTADPYAEQAARILRDALESVGATPADLARALGVNPSLARCYCQPEQQRSLSLVKIVMLCRTAPRLHSELVRRISGACAEVTSAVPDPWRQMVVAMGSCGEIASVVAQVCAAGVVTNELEPKLRRAISMGRQTLDLLERAADAAVKGSR